MSRHGSLFQSQLLLLAACLVLASVDATLLNPTDFISETCKLTKAPRYCLRSLTPFANAIKTDKVQACQVAFNASFTVASRMTHSLIRLSHKLNASITKDPKVVEAVNFCVEKHRDSILQLNFTISAQLGEMMKDEEAEGLLDDLDMNLALTTSNMGDCVRQWDAIPNNSLIKSIVCRRSDKVATVASMALDLLRDLEHVVHSRATPPPAYCRDCVCCPGQKVPEGQCCQCCDAPALPAMEVDKEQLANDMCGKGDSACRKWVIDSN